MSSQIKSVLEPTPWSEMAIEYDVLPFSPDAGDQRNLVSDSVKLRIANALQSSLHVRDIVKGFAFEVNRIVRGLSLRYRHKSMGLSVDHGSSELNRYSYELNLVGRSLGEIIFSRRSALNEDELAILEVLLCALIYPLRNALQYESALKIALKDPLTGVSNRASMGAHLGHHISLAQRQSTPLSLLMIDVDRFKAVNDEYGHLLGDVVLTQVASRIVSCTRTSDGVFRYGGEEFVVVLPSTESAGAELLAERIRSGIEELRFESLPPTVRITASIGVAHLLNGENQTDILRRADEGLMKAKRTGRNQVIIAQTSLAGRA